MTQTTKQNAGFIDAILPKLKAALPALSIAAASGTLGGLANPSVKNKMSGKA